MRISVIISLIPDYGFSSRHTKWTVWARINQQRRCPPSQLAVVVRLPRTSMIAAAFLPTSRGLTAGDDETSASGEFKMREAAPSYVFRLLVTAAKASRSVGPTAVFCGSDPGCREWYEVGEEVGPSVIRIFVVGSH